MADKYALVTGLSQSVDCSDEVLLNIDIRTNDINIAKLFYPGHSQFSGIMAADQEFTCIWCSSPNPMGNRHCSQCGAPRGFVIK